MHRRHGILVALIALSLAVGGCGGKTTAEAIGAGAATLPVKKVESDLATLVPANTDILLYVPSTEVLIEKAKRLTSIFGEKAEKGFDPDEGIRQMTRQLYDHFDRTKPFAISVTVPKGEEPEPVPTMLLPMKDMQAALATFQEAGQEAPKTAGDYLVMAMGPPAEDTGEIADIAQLVPTGDIVVRMNLGRLLENHGETIRQQMDKAVAEGGDSAQPGMPDLSKMLEGMSAKMSDLLDSAEYLDLSLQIEDTDVHVKGLFTAKKGSKMAQAAAASGGLVEMAGALPGEFPIVALLSLNFKEAMKWMTPLMEITFESLPEADRAQFEKSWQEVMTLYDHVGDRSAIGYRFDEKGMAMAMVSDLTDSKKFFEEWQVLLDGDYMKMMTAMGVEAERLPPSKVAGYHVESLRMAFDIEKMLATNPALQDAPPESVEASRKMMERMFGKDGWVMHMADVDGRLVSVLGDDALLEQAIQNAASGAGPTKGQLAAAIEKAGGQPTFLLHIEGRALLKGAFGMVRELMPEKADEIPEIPEGKPLNFLLYTSGDGRYYAGGFSMDVGALQDIVDTFTKK